MSSSGFWWCGPLPNDWVSVANGIVALAAWFAFVRRLHGMCPDTKGLVRLQFVLMQAALFASAFSPLLFREHATYGQLLLSTAVLIGILLSMPRWRHGPPPGTSKTPDDAEERRV